MNNQNRPPITARLRVALVTLLGALLALAVPAAAQALPDGYAYEKVSPNEKGTFDILPDAFVGPDGEDAIFTSFGAFDNDGASLTAASKGTRGTDGWVTDGITPPMAPIGGLNDTILVDVSADARAAMFSIKGATADGAVPEAGNYMRRNADGSLSLITKHESGLTRYPNLDYKGASPDLGTVAFNARAALAVTKGPAPTANAQTAYAGDGTDMWLVSVLPDGSPSPDGGEVGGRANSVVGGWNAVSDDGSRIFWERNPFTGASQVYAWNEEGPATWISASQASDAEPGDGSGQYRYATSDGSRAFFTSTDQLTDDATAVGGSSDLYRYDFADGELTDLTTEDPTGAAIEGVLGVSDDGERVYFAATGVLAAGATAGERNLYVRDGDETTYIAPLAAGTGSQGRGPDQDNWARDSADKRSRTSPDGRYLLFTSSAQIGGYDNAGFAQLYRYDVVEDALDCVSCDPSGAAPTGDTALAPPTRYGVGLIDGRLTTNLADDGTVFFMSPDALVGEDVNGRVDVYVWTDGPDGGSVELISSGKSGTRSEFGDAATDGSSVLFTTRSQLVGIDTDNAIDLYAARLGGGFASQNPPPPPVPCEGDDCLPPPSEGGENPQPGTGTVEDQPSARSCARLDRRAERSEQRSRTLDRKAAHARAKARRLNRAARRADGRRAKRLDRRATRAATRAKRVRHRRRAVAKRVERLERRAARCAGSAA